VSNIYAYTLFNSVARKVILLQKSFSMCNSFKVINPLSRAPASKLIELQLGCSTNMHIWSAHVVIS